MKEILSMELLERMPILAMRNLWDLMSLSHIIRQKSFKYFSTGATLRMSI